MADSTSYQDLARRYGFAPKLESADAAIEVILQAVKDAGLGVQVSGTDSLSSSDFAGAGLIRSGSGWQTPNYSSAAHQATITFNTSLGSLKLLSAGGCK